MWKVKKNAVSKMTNKFLYKIFSDIHRLGKVEKKKKLEIRISETRIKKRSLFFRNLIFEALL